MQVARVRQMRRASRCVVLHGERVWAHQVVSVSNSSVSCRQGADSGQGPPCAQVSLNSTVPAPGCRVQSRRRARRQGRIRLLPVQPASPVDGRRHRVRSLSHYFSTPDSSALPLRPGVHVTVHVQLRCSLPAAGRQCPWPIQHRHESLARVLWWSPGEGPRRSRCAPALPSRRNRSQ